MNKVLLKLRYGSEICKKWINRNNEKDTIKDLMKNVQSCFSIDDSIGIKLKYRDRENDWITLNCDDDFVIAFETMSQELFVDIIKDKGAKRRTSSIGCESPPKKPRLEEAAYTSWHKNGLQFFYYLLRENDKENKKRCVTAIHPRYSVTYRHGKNRKIRVRHLDDKNRPVLGDIFNVYSYVGDIPIEVEAVYACDIRDFLILKATKEGEFFKGDIQSVDSHILEIPLQVGRHLQAIGLSTKDANSLTGTVLSTTENKHGKVVADIIAWGGDSGAPLFSRDVKVLGIVSESFGQDRSTGLTRSRFVPSTALLGALEWLILGTEAFEEIDRWEPACQE